MSNRLDAVEGNLDMRHFETMYALLDQISPGYVKSFGESLASKLAEIKDDNCEESGNI